MKIEETVVMTVYGNREIAEWINKTFEGKGFEREAAFATIRFLAEKYPELNSTLNVGTYIDTGEEGG